MPSTAAWPGLERLPLPALPAVLALGEGEFGIAVLQFAAIEAGDVRVLDRFDMCHEPCLQSGLVLGRVQWLGIAFDFPQDLDQAFRLTKNIFHGLGALGLDQVVRVHAFGQAYDAQRVGRAQQGQGAGDRPHRGALAGGIAVEAQDRALDMAP